jgi:alanine racemase
MPAQCSPPAAPAAARDARPHSARVDADRARAWLEVDLAALVRNARALRGRAAVPLVPMVKAEAYGLGAVPVARALASLGPGAVWGYGVATVAEGEALRAASLDAPLLVCTPLVAGDLARARRAGLTPSLHRADDVRAWAALGDAPWHLGIDTGMARAGVRWDALGDDLVAAARAHPPEGAFTHFHSADCADGTREAQEARFAAALARLPARPLLLHAENSPAVVRGGRSRWDLVRPGVFLYGAAAAEEGAVPNASGAGPAPEPVALGTGPRRIATLAVGYADGYRRALSGRGVALLHGHRAPVVGRVTMDMTMLDVTGVPCAVGDVATLLGRDGDAVLSVDEVARAGDLSPYELLAGLRLRVPHLYTDA